MAPSPEDVENNDVCFRLALVMWSVMLIIGSPYQIIMVGWIVIGIWAIRQDSMCLTLFCLIMFYCMGVVQHHLIHRSIYSIYLSPPIQFTKEIMYNRTVQLFGHE
jgi:hypothetical protein